MPLGTRWLRLFLASRVTATAVAVVLLGIHRVTPHDHVLILLGGLWGTISVAAAWTRPELFTNRLAWVADAAAVLALIWASEDFRSPFYLLALTALAAPAAALPLRPAVFWGAAFTAAYGATAIVTGLDVRALRTTVQLDTLATHLLLPMVWTGGIAYSADAMRRLAAERGRAERLAVETERRRIAWELHDSAKQRLHAAALMLSAVDAEGDSAPMVRAALQEVQGAVADMETSIAELQSPLEGRPLDRALRDRAAELEPLTTAAITVRGSAPALPAATASHVYRIVAEAMANAVRHAGAEIIDVRLDADDGVLRACVTDDGAGLPGSMRPGASGLLTMRSRAFAIGGRLSVEAGGDGRGTRIRLDVPLTEGAVP